jgi:hypothetical protein
MKTTLALVPILTTLALTPAFAQLQPAPPPAQLVRQGVPVSDASKPPELTRFSLDFGGGIPEELIVAIEKAMGKPVNAIIPEEHAQVRLPPLKMSNVNLPQLFEALALASSKTETYLSRSASGYGVGAPSYHQTRTSFGFRTESKPVSDDTIWYFYVDKPVLPPPTPPVMVCRFYSLAPYLDRGLPVDDITTAIQTGWKMLGDKDTPTINYHKDTKLLIAVGEASKLETIDAVLKALQSSPDTVDQRLKPRVDRARPTPPAPAPAPKSPEKPRPEN